MSGQCGTSGEKSGRRQNVPKSAHNGSELLCATLWVRAGYFGFGLAQFEAQCRLEIEDFQPDP